MDNLHQLMDYLVEHGQYKPNRTGVGAYASIGHSLKFDLQKAYPAVTSKKLMMDAVKGELVGFFRGYDNAADFRSVGCNIWDQNANETPSWLANEHRQGVDHLGRIYGVQWTQWRDTRFAKSQEQADKLHAKGYTLMAEDSQRKVWVFERPINQLEEALRTLINDPFNRRIIVNGWRPDELDQMALPPCHVAYCFGCMPDGTLHSTMWQRSVDTFLGLPFNIASTALFTHIMARLAGREVGSTTLFLTDTHLYENHIDQAKLQLSRTHFDAPRLVLSDRIKKIERDEDIAGAFARINPEDIWLEGYKSHPGIKAPMAA